MSRPEIRAADASEDLRQACAVDERGMLVFPAKVVGLREDGAVELEYRIDKSRGVEHLEHLQPRFRMPWHPRFLKGQLVLMLRRNLGRGHFLDGLEIRWGRLSRALRALMTEGVWRLGEENRLS